jgi:hypothetical protein
VCRSISLACPVVPNALLKGIFSGPFEKKLEDGKDVTNPLKHLCSLHQHCPAEIKCTDVSHMNNFKFSRLIFQHSEKKQVNLFPKPIFCLTE